jgi:hypothetical protein
LIAAQDHPALLQTFFNLPVGEYDGIRGALEILNFSVVGRDGPFCTVSHNEASIPPVVVDGPALNVTDRGAALLIDIPVLSGECDPAAGPIGTLTIDFANVSVGPKS